MAENGQRPADLGRPPCSKGWAARCAAGTSTRCECACGGHGHGIVHGKSLADVRDASLQAKERRQLEKYHAKRKGQLAMFDPQRAPEYGLIDTPIRGIQGDSQFAALERQRPDGWMLVCVRVNNEPHFSLVNDAVPGLIPFEQRIVRHSPTGMEWGYGGSGPADLALNILALFVDPREANRLHQDFKWHTVAGWQRDEVSYPLADAKRWLMDTWASEALDREKMDREEATRRDAQAIREADAADARAVEERDGVVVMSDDFRMPDDVDDGAYIADQVSARDDEAPNPYE